MDLNLLVCWVDDEPKKFSISSRSDIVDGSLKGLPHQQLIGKILELKWKRKICRAKILASGTKEELKRKLDEQINLATLETASHSGSGQPSLTLGKKTNPTIANTVTQKKSKLDSALSLVDGNSSQFDDTTGVIEQVDPKDLIISGLKQELNTERALHQNCKEELERIRGLYENLLEGGSDEIDIGSGILVKKDALTTLKAVSSTLNIFCRNLFRNVFEDHEVVGRSLMGRKCNAVKYADQQPSVDPQKRDAVIEFALSTYGRKPGSENYKLSKKDLKHSLGNLVTEMNKGTKVAEQQVLNLDEED